jgi:hypothetical protein
LQNWIARVHPSIEIPCYYEGIERGIDFLPKKWEEIEKIDRVKLLMERWISPSRHLHQKANARQCSCRAFFCWGVLTTACVINVLPCSKASQS